MRMIFYEIKKIWSLKILGIIALVCALFYVMFMSYYIEYYRGNHPATENIYYAEELVRLYGTTITPDEFSEYVTREYGRIKTEAENYFRTIPIFAQAGIYTLEDFNAMRENRHSPESETAQMESDAFWTLYGEECDYLGFNLETLEFMADEFERKSSYIDNPDSFWVDLNERERERYRELIQNGEHYSILSYWTYENTNNYAVAFSILAILAALILVSPLLVSDRHVNLHHLQYSSRLGRKIINRQLAAILLSSFLLTTLLILVFGGIYSTNGTYLFWGSNINSEFNLGSYFVFSMTYGQWVTAMIILMYALVFGVSTLAFILSRFSRNLIVLVMKLIPLFAAVAFLCAGLFNYSFSMLYAPLYQISRVFGIEIYVCGVIVISCLMASLFVIRREKRVDVV